MEPVLVGHEHSFTSTLKRERVGEFTNTETRPLSTLPFQTDFSCKLFSL